MELMHSATRYRADGAPAALLVLAHGAGAGQRHPFMVTVAGGLAARGVDVVTFDFPYMAQGRRAPDRAPVLEDSFRRAIDEARDWSGADRLFIGGKSMGGRMATHLGAQRVEHLSGIVVFGYPLHPPGRPDQLRVSHLASIAVPLLVVQGERDTFGTPDELRPHIEQMTADVTLHVVEGGDHSLAVGRARAPRYDEVLDVVRGWMSPAAAAQS
jgi:uncharacterized protein